MWDLVPWPGIKPGPLALRQQSLSHWTTREVPQSWFKTVRENIDSQNWNLELDKFRDALSLIGLYWIFLSFIYSSSPSFHILVNWSLLPVYILYTCIYICLYYITTVNKFPKLGTLNVCRDYIYIYWVPGMCMPNRNSNVDPCTPNTCNCVPGTVL